MNPKAPCLALIVQDCRDGAPASGQYGIYEGDMPRRIQFVEPGDIAHRWREAVYCDNNIALIKASTMVESGSFVLRAAELLGITLPVYGCDETAIKCLNQVHELSEKLRHESTCGYYFFGNNPRILLEDGTHIWGDECWWKPVDEKLQGQKLTELLERSNQQVKEFCELLVAVTEAAKVEISCNG